LLDGFGLGHHRDLFFPPLPPPCRGICFHGGAEGDTVQPVGDPLPRPDGRCLLGKNQKGRLKGVLGVMMVADDPVADAPDHWPVAMDKCLKSYIIFLLDKGRQQLSVRPARRTFPQNGPAKMPDHRVDRSRRHSRPPWPVAFDFYPFIAPPEAVLYTSLLLHHREKIHHPLAGQ
jgi:hypothetical protein